MLTKLLEVVFPKFHQNASLKLTTYDDLQPHLAIRQYEKNQYALFDFNNPLIRTMIHAVKYQKNKHVAQLFAQALTDFLAAHRKNYIAIPIPQSRQRKRERGYNQAELVAQALPYTCLPKLLIKIKNTRSQTELSRSERLENVMCSMSVDKKIAATISLTTPIVIVDDVYTTGATAQEALRALYDAGFRDVLFVAVASGRK